MYKVPWRYLFGSILEIYPKKKVSNKQFKIGSHLKIQPQENN